MALKLLHILVFTLISTSANAECETEAFKASEIIMASGPFQYSGTRTDKKLSGLIVPLRAHHSLTGDYYFQEEISIDNQTWVKSDAGWFQPEVFRWKGHTSPIEIVLPWHVSRRHLSTTIASAKCLGSVEKEGKSLNGYELQYKDGLREQFFVEPATGLTIRMESPAYRIVLNFHYDASIKIEPPKIAADAPKAPLPHGWGALKF